MMQQAQQTFSADPLLVIISAIVLAVTLVTVGLGLLKILPDAMRDRRNANSDPNSSLATSIFNNHQVFVVALSLLCLIGFLLTAYGVLFIESLAVRSYFVRLPLFVAALSITALVVNIARVRAKLRRHYFNLGDESRSEIRKTLGNTEQIKGALDIEDRDDT